LSEENIFIFISNINLPLVVLWCRRRAHYSPHPSYAPNYRLSINDAV